MFAERASDSHSTPTPTAAASAPRSPQGVERSRIDLMLSLLREHVPMLRNVLQEGDVLFAENARFTGLHVPNSGSFKSLGTSHDRRRQVTGLHLRGDIIGFEGLASGIHPSEAIALETSEVWSFSHDLLMQACQRQPALLLLTHEAMSRSLDNSRRLSLSLRSLPSLARVAEFIRWWSAALAERGLRNDRMLLRLSRSELGNYLGMTIETVSRSMSRLNQLGLIEFVGVGRREIHVPDGVAMADFIRNPRP